MDNTRKLKSLLDADEQDDWLFYEEHVADPENWQPLCYYVDGIRCHVLYKNKIENDKYKYLTVFIGSGSIDITDMNFEEAKKKYEWIISSSSKN